MRISLCSDLHLECGYTELPGEADVLILAGDVAEAKNVSNHHYSTKLVSDAPNIRFACSEFFKWECAKYPKVFYVMGNHEHYRGKYHETKDILSYIVPSNVTILEQEAVEYNGVMFMGATLWTDLNRGDPITAHDLKEHMNDYHRITFKEYDNYYHKLRPNNTKDFHVETLRYFKNTLDANIDKPFVVVTHHAPSDLSVHERFKNDYHLNGGYRSRLEDFIFDHPNIKYWCHGHVHNVCDYTIGDTRVLCNPRGYQPYESDNGFNPFFTFEV